MSERETYLGDGVYAVFDGYHVILDLRAQDSTTRIALEPAVFAALNKFVEFINESAMAKQTLAAKRDREAAEGSRLDAVRDAAEARGREGTIEDCIAALNRCKISWNDSGNQTIELGAAYEVLRALLDKPEGKGKKADTHDGKWIAIPDEDSESFQLGKPFDAREDAEEYARDEYMNAVARLQKFKAQDAAFFVDADRFIEELDESANDEWSKEDALLGGPRDMKAAEEDLRDLVAGWIDRHGILESPAWYQAVEVHAVPAKAPEPSVIDAVCGLSEPGRLAMGAEGKKDRSGDAWGEARFSDCQTYRYRLERTWGHSGRLTWVMLNPSTADATQDDPTIRRIISFTKTFGYDGAWVVNLFALRATDPAQLKCHRDPVGPLNFQEITAVFDAPAPIICAWGANAAAKEQAAKFLWRAYCEKRQLFSLGRTKRGSPRHPLYVPASQTMEPFPKQASVPLSAKAEEPGA